MKDKSSLSRSPAKKNAKQFSQIPDVLAVAVGGSLATGSTDNESDLDLYIYSQNLISISAREAISRNLNASKINLNLTYWDIADEWIDTETGIAIDIMYWNKTWIEDQIKRVLVEHQANVGYSTCFWYTVLNSDILFDRTGWFTELQKKCDQPYPEELRKSIIVKNYPILRNIISSYHSQIEKAIKRKDIVSVNHRIAALLASYFDILFALNRIPNPGEKKLIDFCVNNCQLLPVNFKGDITDILYPTESEDNAILDSINHLIDNLDKVLSNEGLI